MIGKTFQPPRLRLRTAAAGCHSSAASEVRCAAVVRAAILRRLPGNAPSARRCRSHGAAASALDGHAGQNAVVAWREIGHTQNPNAHHHRLGRTLERSRAQLFRAGRPCRNRARRSCPPFPPTAPRKGLSRRARFSRTRPLPDNEGSRHRDDTNCVQLSITRQRINFQFGSIAEA